MEYGWWTVKDSLHPVYFEGNMSAEFLRDLVCSWRGNRNVESPMFVQSRTLHVLTYVLAKDQNHIKTSILIPLHKTFNVFTTYSCTLAWRAVSLFCKDLVSLKSCVEQLQFPQEKRQFQSFRMHCTVVLPYFLLIYILLMHFVAYKKFLIRI